MSGYHHHHSHSDARRSPPRHASHHHQQQQHHDHQSSHHSSHAPPPPPAPAARTIRDAPPGPRLIMRGLSPSVTETTIMSALSAFRPTLARVIYNKPTGESRGFGFVDFKTTEDAKQVVLAYTHGPLLLDGHPVMIGYTDNNRTHARYGAGDGDSRLGAAAPGDWICALCHGTNFARRTECFKCEARRQEHAREVPRDQQGGWSYGGSGDRTAAYGSRPDSSPSESRPYSGHHEDDSDEPPSTVVLVRDLPQYTEEGELHIAFAEFEGVTDIRLIRDRVTHHSRGFGFVEFVDAESAAAALGLESNVRVHGQRVRLSLARDNGSHPSRHRSALAPPPHVPNSIAAAALEQAQWALSNGYGGGTAQQEPTEQNASLDAEVTTFLESVAAAVPRVERPKKQWPLPFETGGGSYVFVGELGFYYDPDSQFYYDAQAKLYYSSFTSEYFRCCDGAKGALATFAPFAPPVPVDDAPYSASSGAARPPPSSAATPSGAASGAAGAFSLTLSKKEKKKPLAFGTVAGSSIAASKLKDAFSGEPPAPAAAAATSIVGVTASMKRKNAGDIAKWSQLQRVSKTAGSAGQQNAAPLASPAGSSGARSTAVSPATNAKLDNLVSAAAEAPICLLCRRKFTSMELLRKHETLSKLHLENLAKAKADKTALAAQYREVEQERKEREEEEKSQDRKRQRVASTAPAPSSSAAAPAPSTAPSLESGIGGKMLKMMGWKSGEGLGKHGTGITAPVAAVGNLSNETAGVGARPAAGAPAPIDLSDIASYKERLQQMARARYDSAPRGL